MHILFLSHYFPPEVNAPATRCFEHCRRWVAAGHAVTVVTCVPNHPRGRVYPGYRHRLWQTEQMDGIQVVRVWTWLSANEGFVRRTLNYVSFILSAILAAPFLAASDVVLSTSPQFFNGLAGWFVSRVKRAPWVLEIRDLWPESIFEVGAIRNRTVIRALEWLESFAYRKADRIVAVTDAFKEHIVARGAAATKVEVIKNGVDPTRYSPLEGDNPLADEIGVRGRFVAAYFGTHGMAHHLETVLEAAAELRDEPDIVFLLAGDGAERQALLAKREQMGLGNVIMLDQQPKERMRALWALADVSLVLLKRSALFRTVIPSKIFESLAMARPVILGVRGESLGIIEAAQAGVGMEPENAIELATAVRALRDDPARRRLLGENGRRYVCEHFDRDRLAARYLALLESLVAVRRAHAVRAT